MMKQVKAKIIENKKIAADIYKIRIESPYLAKEAKPGQFLEVKCSERGEPLLRRPLGLHRKTKDGIELLYEVVGKGTELLATKKTGELLDIIGPLGNGFDLRTTNHATRTTLLIAGGIGVAPLLALAEELSHGQKKKIHALIGAKTKKHILCEKKLQKLGVKVHISTDDGSRGRKGFVTDLLKDFLRTTNHATRTTLYACGPTAMLKTVAAIAGTHHIPCQVSLEERMACGVGVCLGCPVKVHTNHEPRTTNHAYKMVCKDGPVFNAEEIAW